MASSFILAFALMITGANGQDLLDIVPTDQYWAQQRVSDTSTQTLVGMLGPDDKPVGDISKHAENLGSQSYEVREAASQAIAAMGPGVIPQLKKLQDSNDAEVAARARALIEQLSMKGKEGEIRKLMAIRTLGERKAKDAADTLKKLTDSKAPFVADYAKAALAAIEGRTYERPGVDEKTIASDLALIPGDVDGVGFTRGAGGPGRIDYDKLFKMLPDEAQKEKDKILSELTREIVRVAHKVGNVRVDHIAVGFKGNPDSRDGFLVLVARGQYDRDAWRNFAKEEGGLKPGKLGDIPTLAPPADGMILMPSDNQIVLLAAENKLPTDSVVKMLKSKDAKPSFNADLAKLLKTVDQKSAMWFAGKLDTFHREIPPIRAFQTLTLTINRKGDGLDFEFVGRGKDANQVKQAIMGMQISLTAGLGMLKQQAQQYQFLDSYVKFLESMKFETKDGKATVKARLEGDVNNHLMLPATFFMGFRASVEAAEAVEAPAQAMPAQRE